MLRSAVLLRAARSVGKKSISGFRVYFQEPVSNKYKFLYVICHWLHDQSFGIV